MTWLSDQPRVRGDAGFSLLELLIALAILSATLAVAVSMSSGPSDTARLRADAARIINAAASARLRAMNEAVPERFKVKTSDGLVLSNCLGGPVEELVYLPSGGVRGKPICLARSNASLQLVPDWLTGLIRIEDAG